MCIQVKRLTSKRCPEPKTGGQNISLCKSFFHFQWRYPLHGKTLLLPRATVFIQYLNSLKILQLVVLLRFLINTQRL